MLNDPDQMTIEQREAEIAAILAEGMIRLCRRPGVSLASGDAAQQESAQNGLELSRETPLHGANGLTPARAHEKE